MERLQEAEEQYIKAINLYSKHFPHSIGYANSLYHLGMLYGSNGRSEEACVKLMEARQLYERVGTQRELDKCDLALQNL